METDKLGEMLRSGDYLPDFMKDTHDSKNLFKAIEDFIVNNRRNSDNSLLSEGNINWCDAMIYNVDVFLYFLAEHGYSIQKMDGELPFLNLDDTINEWKTFNRERYIKNN